MSISAERLHEMTKTRSIGEIIKHSELPNDFNFMGVSTIQLVIGISVFLAITIVLFIFSIKKLCC